MAERWFVEEDPFSPINYRYAIQQVLHERQSAVQRIQVMEHAYFGRMLALDGVLQLTERDECFYHEMLAHVPMHSHPGPRHALIVGGGDGGTLREVLRHPSIESATLVDIDPEVTEVAQAYLPFLASSFEDPRARSVAQDGASFLNETSEKYDIILVDAPDPVGPARTLSTPEFFQSVSAALSSGGVFAMQTESLHFHVEFVQSVQRRVAEAFRHTGLYAISVATYAGNWWSFAIASNDLFPTEPFRRPVPGLRYYCEEAHRQAHVSKELLQRLVRQAQEFEQRRHGGPSSRRPSG